MTRADVRQAILDIIEELVPDEDLTNIDDKEKSGIKSNWIQWIFWT